MNRNKNGLKLLDLYCGAGGCSVGYYRAGYEVTGVDKYFQKNYPFEFIQADALDVLKDIEYCRRFDIIHASPVCKRYSRMTPKSKRLNHADDIEEVRELLTTVNRPFVIENVPGAPLKNYVILDGFMFGLKVKRLRLFECSPMIVFPPADGGYTSNWKKGTFGNSFKNSRYIGVYGKSFRVEDAKLAMGIDWMVGKELSQAIPPVYTEWIGKAMFDLIKK